MFRDRNASVFLLKISNALPEYYIGEVNLKMLIMKITLTQIVIKLTVDKPEFSARLRILH
jgi:hypothetical protein